MTGLAVITRSSLAEWQSEPSTALTAWAAKTRRSVFLIESCMDWNKTQLIEMLIILTYTQFLLVNNILANEVFRELHTVSEESPCCHSVVFEALEKGTVSIFVFTKFPFSCAFFATSTSKTILCSVPFRQLRSATRNIPFPKWNRVFRKKRDICTGVYSQSFPLLLDANGGQTELELLLYRTAPYKRAMASKRASSQNRCICH